MMILKKKNSRDIVDSYVGRPTSILYVRYSIQALEQRCKRTWDSILWGKKKRSKKHKKPSSPTLMSPTSWSVRIYGRLKL